MKKTGLAFLLSCLLVAAAFGQDSAKSRAIRILPVPAFGYSPETRTYIGAVSLFTIDFYHDSLTRKSNAKLELNYTWNKQLITELGWNYFFRQERWFTKGLLHFSRFPDFYYGIGPETADSQKLVYNSNRYTGEAFALKQVGNGIFTGMNVKYARYANLSVNDSLNVYPELQEASTFGLGWSLMKDTRNSLLTPTKGWYYNVNATYNFSDADYWEILLDLRHYHSFKNKSVLAMRFVNDLNLGTVPFFDYAMLGGDKFVRGYYYGRYRDKNLSNIQLEYRLPVYRRWGLAAFGGLANLYSAEHPFSLQQTKYNAGMGIRFLVDRKDNTNLRIDYAVGKDKNDGFYISFGESF